MYSDVILVPVNDCRRQEFTGTAYTAAKVFKTAVNFGREYTLDKGKGLFYYLRGF